MSRDLVEAILIELRGLRADVADLRAVVAGARLPEQDGAHAALGDEDDAREAEILALARLGREHDERTKHGPVRS